MPRMPATPPPPAALTTPPPAAALTTSPPPAALSTSPPPAALTTPSPKAALRGSSPAAASRALPPLATLRALPPLAALRSFASVARLGGFARAAAALNVSTSAVSHQIRGLEDTLGVRLIERSTGTGDIRLTRAGSRLLAAVEAALLPLAEVCESLRGPRGRRRRLVITANHPLFTLWLAPRLSRFAALHPAADVRGVTVDGPPQRAGQQIDLAIVHLRTDQELGEDTVLFDETVFPVCSPELLRAAPTLREDPRALFAQRLLQEEHPLSPETDWDSWAALLGLPPPAEGAKMHFSSFGPTIGAAIAGSGVALGRAPLIADALASGRLLRLLPRMSMRGSWRYVLRVRRDADPLVQALRAFLLAEAGGDAPAQP